MYQLNDLRFEVSTNKLFKKMKAQKINPTIVNQRMNWFQKFLLVCSGGNIHILRKTPSEWNKFAGIGGIILFTAVFATLSAGYAMFTVFDDIWISVGFSILWGLMIFNLDRYIVSSIKKTGTWWNNHFQTLGAENF